MDYQEGTEDGGVVTIEAISSGSAQGGRYKLSEGNLNLLQEFLRRDPDSYRDEFIQQFHHFQQASLLYSF